MSTATRTAIPIVGDEAFGGIVVGRVEPVGRPGWLLIAAPTSLEVDGLKWQTERTAAPASTRDPIDGFTASYDMAKRPTDFPAARYCVDLDFPRDAGSSWYLPSRHELWLMWLALRGTEHELTTGERPWYWSSTEDDAALAWNQYSGGSYAGYQNNGTKTDTNIRVRPVRQVVLSAFDFDLSQPRVGDVLHAVTPVELANASVVLDRDGDAWQRRGDWSCVDRGIDDIEWAELLVRFAPLTVLHLGDES